jgi:hypothetical protein
MTNDKDITRYEVNEHGELHLSYGRYVRWEDYEDAVLELRKEIARLENKLDECWSDYDEGFSDGYSTCEAEHGD